MVPILILCSRVVGHSIVAQINKVKVISENSPLYLQIKAHRSKCIPNFEILNVANLKRFKIDILVSL